MGMVWQRGWSVASCIPIGAGLSQDWSDGDGCPDTRSRARALKERGTASSQRTPHSTHSVAAAGASSQSAWRGSDQTTPGNQHAV